MKTKPLLDYMLRRQRRAQDKIAFPNDPQKWYADKDGILATYRFCNVEREKDAVTQWISENILDYYGRDKDWNFAWPVEEVFFMLCVARAINWPPTLAAMMRAEVWPRLYSRGWNWGGMVDVMTRRLKEGKKVYTGAYMVRTNAVAFSEPQQKPWATVNVSLVPIYNMRGYWRMCLEDGVWTQEALVAELSDYMNWGPFMAYEVACDLDMLMPARDRLTWANAGPGAKRGLNRLAGRDLRKGRGDWLEEMRYLYERLEPRMTAEGVNFNMRTVEHNLCEFDKFERVRLGEGKPRARFSPIPEDRSDWNV